MLKANEELRVCADAHEQAVIFDDEYGIGKIADQDKEVQYIVDIGANVGAASVMFQKNFPEAKILCCEPAPDNMKYARENTEDKLIYVEKAIVGDSSVKEVKFNLCGWAGNHHVDGHFRWDLFEPMGSRLVSSITVPAVTLRDIMVENEFPRIDILKIDCEGLEGGILQAFKPWMHLVKHFRGEWHGDSDIPLIEDALKDTHNVTFDRRFTTHGGIIAELK